MALYKGYPVIPLVGFWDDSQSFRISPLELSISDGALTSLGPRDRINKTKHNWSISGNLKNGIELDGFLKERMYRPFGFSFSGNPEDMKLYSCSDYSLTLLSYVTESDYQLWAFKGTFNQQFRADIEVTE